MHICLIASEFPPAPGSIADYSGHMARMLARAGHRVTIFAPGDVHSAQCLPNGARLIRLVPHQMSSVPSLFKTLSHVPALSYEFAEAIIEHLRSTGDAPDVIEVQEYGALGYYLLQRRLVDDTPLHNIPILVHLHSPYSGTLRMNQAAHYRFPDYWVGQMERFCINAADALLSPSHFLKDYLLRYGYTDRPIDVIPYPGVDPSAENEMIYTSNGLMPGDIVYVGRLEIRKGVLPLVKACARLWSDGADFRLTLIGGDTTYASRGTTVSTFLREKYQHWIKGNRLILSGPMRRTDVQERLRSAWTVVIPSLYENLPYTCIEAMSAGKVVIASASGGQAEMVGSDGQAGWLFDWAEKGCFERSLTAALNMSVDENRAMGVRARQRIAALTSYDVVLPQRIEHYHKTIEQAEARRHSRVFPSVNWDVRPALSPLVTDPDAEKGLLSVVIPFYNLGDYIQETLASVFSSTYRPLEVVVVDDGSDDPTGLAALDRVREHSQISVRILRTVNQGPASARNCGADATRGEYLAFVDADDLVQPDFFARAVRILQAYDNVGFVYSWVQYFGDNDEWWPTWNTEFPYLLGHNMLIPIVVMRRAVFQQHARFRPVLEQGYEDWDAWVRLAAAGYQGVSVPHLLVKYRVRRNSRFRRINLDQSLYLHDLIAQGSPETYRRYAVELFGLMNANGPHHLWVHPAMQAQRSSYNTLKMVFFWLASRPGMGWLHWFRMPLKRLYGRLR